MELYFFCLKYHQISIEIYQNSKFLAFLWKFLYSNLENRNRFHYASKKFMKLSFKSTDYFLFVMICFIFFGCVVRKEFILKVYFFCLKYHQISIEIYSNFKFLAFLWKFLYRNLENRNRCHYVSKQNYEITF